MLADWYFCTALRLTILQTSDYLETLEILRAPGSDPQLLGAAVDWLGNAETSLRLHALVPLLSAADRLRAEPALAERAAALCADLLAQDSDQSDEERAADQETVAEGLAALLREAVRGPEDDFAERLLALLRRQIPPPGSSAEPTPYQNLHEHVTESVALTLLDFAAQLDPGAVAPACVAQSRLPLVDSALGSVLGRLPLLLAASALRRVSPGLSGPEVRESLAGAGAGDLEPDLLNSLARSWFGHPYEEHGPQAEVLEAELATGLLLRQWPATGVGSSRQRAAVRARLGTGDVPDRAVRAVLWQLTLWELAALHQPARVVRLTQRWWGPPADMRDERLQEQPAVWLPWPDSDPTDEAMEAVSRWLGDAACMHWAGRPFGTYHLPVAPPDAPGVDPGTACSPWLDRKDASFQLHRKLTRNEQTAQSRYPRGESGLSLLQVLVTTSIAVRLLRTAEDDAASGTSSPVSATLPRAHLVALIFHCKDVLTDTRLRFLLGELRSRIDPPRDLTVGSGIAALAWHVHRSVNRAGKGVYPEVPVAWFADFLLDGPGTAHGGREPGGSEYHGTQWTRLFTAAALHGVRDWIEESASGIREASAAADLGIGWFGGSMPYARRVLAAVVDRLREVDEHGRAALRSVQLLRQEFPGAGVRDDVKDDLDWMTALPKLLANYRKARKEHPKAYSPLNRDMLLAADPYPLQRWVENAADIESLSRDGATHMTMATLRLAVLLSESEPGADSDVPQWVDEWLDLMSKVNDPFGWARTARDRAVDLFQLPRKGPAAQDRIRLVLEAVIDGIAEFSPQAPRYIQRMLEALATDQGPLYHEGMDRLRVRAVNAIRLNLVGEREPQSGGGPRDSLNQVAARQIAETLLRSFVAEASTRVLAWNDLQTLGRAFLDSWLRVGVESAAALVPASSETADGAADPRLISARVLNRYTGAEYYGLLDRAVGRRANGTEAADPTALDVLERDERLARWRRFPEPKNVTATVCAIDPGGPDGGAVLVNWGSGMPLRIPAGPAERQWKVGDLCVATVRWNPGSRQWEPASPKALHEAGRPRPRHGELRPARLSTRSADGGLSVSVNGVQNDVLRKRNTDQHTATAALRYWDPDLSRAFGPDLNTDEADETLARWDEDLGQWLPADRTLTELIAGDLPYRAADGSRAMVLVYVGPGDTYQAGQQETWRFATSPGRNFLLGPDDWDTDRTELDDVLENGPGVLVYVGLIGTDSPRLVLLPDPPARAERRWPALRAGSGCDTRNNDWLTLFNYDDHAWQAVLEHGTWTADVSAAPNYPHGAGFPAKVSVTGLDTTAGGRCPFRPEPWDEAGARAAEVAGEPLRRESLSDLVARPPAERFAELWEPARYSVHAVKRFRGGRTVVGSYVEAVIEDGRVVRVDRNSLLQALPPTRGSEPLPAVEITSVGKPHPRSGSTTAPLPASHFTGLLGSSAEVGESIEAVVVEVYWGSGSSPDRYGVWLRANGTVRPDELPAGCFTTAPRRVGDTATGALTPQGWQFTPTGRPVHARVLHRYEKANAVPADPSWRFLGWFKDRGISCGLYARLTDGSVLVIPQRRSPDSPLGLRAQAVERLGSAMPRHGIPHKAIRVDAGSVSFAADAPETSPVPGTVTSVEPEVTLRPDGRLSLRRTLTIADAATQRRSPQANRSAEETWRRQLAAGETVQVRGRLSRGALHVSKVRLPLVDSDAPYVAGASYSDERVTALLVERDGRLRADTRLVPPSTVPEFAAEVAGIPDTTSAYRQNLSRYVYYVGTEIFGDRTMRRFEWGRGSTVLFGAEELTVAGHPCDDERSFPLFHGDRLVSADFQVGKDGRTVVNINPELDVEYQTASLAYEEADKGIVHRLLVEADPVAGRITVKQVRLRRPRITDQPDQSQSRTITAELDEKSRDRILETLAASPSTPGELVQLEILARFDRKEYVRERGRRRLFSYVESRFASAGGPGLVAEDHLFMVAGGITRPDENDTYIEFRLPSNVLRTPGAEPLTVQVARKQFSCREYLLPQLLDEGRAHYYTDHAVMLVKVRKRPDGGRWYGDLTQQRGRDAATLASAVDQAGGSLLAVLADNQARRVELRPGVICELGTAEIRSGVGRAGRGALVQISRYPQSLRVVLAQRPDHNFVPQEGSRPALLLPKQPLLPRQPQRIRWALEKADDAGMFTVTGLPAISVTAAPHGASLLRSPHPRIMTLRTSGHEQLAEPPGDDPIRAAKVKVSGPRPTAQVVSPSGERTAGSGSEPGRPQPFTLPWPLLSFRDTDVTRLRDLAARTWTYHDSRTGHVSHRELRTYAITDRSIANEPVFFDEHDGAWTLRYRPEVIGRFGVPATALTERRPAARQQGNDEPGSLSDTYVVACPAVRPGQKAPWGVWVELSPGHVLEIGGPLLAGPGLVPLDNMPWGHFGPGDLITLEPVRRNITEPRRLRLLDWKPGPRSALLPEPPPGVPATGRALLPVSNVDDKRGCLRLGSGNYVLQYPVSPADADRYKPGYAVWLHRTNKLTSAANATPTCCDTGLLGLNRDGSLKLLALRGLRAEPSADPAGWPGTEWLGELLRGPQAVNLLRELHGCLPVTIERVDGEVVVFSRRLQPSGEWPTHRLLRCAVVGALDGMLLLRSGGALFRLPVQEVAGGVPDAHAASVARTLAVQRQVVWCQRTGLDRGMPRVTTWLSSSPTQPTVYLDEFDALPLAAIESDGAPVGVLLRSVHDQGIRWMPADESTWLDQPTSAELRSFIVDPQLTIRVRSIQGGQVSATGVRAVRHQRTSLTLGSAVRVEPCAPPQLDLSGRSTTVARVSATALLVRLVIKPEECPLHEPVLAEAAELGTADYPNAVQVVLHGQRLHPVDLPKRLATGTPGPASREQDRLAAEYARWWNEGLQEGPASPRLQTRPQKTCCGQPAAH